MAMPLVQQRVQDVRDRIAWAAERSGRSPEDITLVTITKAAESPAVREAIEAGLVHFGENRVQEAQRKLAELADIRLGTIWHLVGHLQSNKVKTALDLFDIIHSVDSLSLAQALDDRAQTVIPVLLEVNVADEATQTGLSPQELAQVLPEIQALPNLEVRGLMTIAPLVSDPEEVRPVFRRLRWLRNQFQLQELSMGMSNDFEVAIEEGATMVRVGRAILGEERG